MTTTTGSIPSTLPPAVEPPTRQQGKATIIYGPQGCGKTRHGEALARHFGKSNVVNELTQGMSITPDMLAFTNDPDFEGAIPIETALQEAGLYSAVNSASNLNLSE